MVRVCLLSLGFSLSIVLLGAVGDFVRAEGTIERTQGFDLREVEADKLLEQGIQQYKISQFDAALQSWEKALKLYRELKDRLGEGNALGNLGVVYYTLGNYPKAIEFHEQSLEIARKLKDRLGEGNALGNLGLISYTLGNYPEAIDFYEQSLEIARELKNRKGEGNVLLNLGIIYTYLSNYPKAIDLYEQSLAIAREIENQYGEGNTLGNLGAVYRILGNYPKAIEFHEQSLEIARKLKDRLGEGSALGNLGNVHYSLGNYSEAIEFHKQSLKIVRELKSLREERQALGNLGVEYHALGDYAKAIEYHEESLEIARNLEDPFGERQALSNMGSAYHALGDYSKAIEYYEKSLAIACEIEDSHGKRITLHNFGVTLATQEPELAIVFYKQAVKVSERIRQDNHHLSRETQELYTSSIAKTYRNLADLLLTQGRTREAQEILELLKVQENRGYDRASQSQQPIIQLTLHPLEQQAIQDFETAIARKQTLTLQDYQKLNETLVQNRDRLIQEGNAKKSTIGNPKNLITNPNAILIQNLIVNDKVWVVWTSQSGGTKAISTPVSQTELDQTVTQFRQQISSPFSNLASLQATSQKLYNWLIPPALQTELARSPKQHLIFSLDHVTRYIPVATLHDGQQYLTQRYQLSNIITTDTDTSDRLPAVQNTPVLALGTAQEFPGFGQLKYVPIELQSISQDGNPNGLYPGQKYLNAGFNRDVLKKLDRYRVVHIATHGQFNPTNILNSFLLLGNGDRLPISEIDQLTNLTNTHLVVLSACETGLGEVKSDGTEISGMSGYFLYRGAKSVMASLWSVSDPSTALSMQQFYSHLAQGKTKAEALQQVQQDFIQGKLTTKEAGKLRASMGDNTVLDRVPNYTHPFYWAPFILVGNSF
jgi:CHAT domain-containing protein